MQSAFQVRNETVKVNDGDINKKVQQELAELFFSLGSASEPDVEG